MSDSSDPMDCSLPGSFIHGIFQTRVLEWGAIAFSKHFLMVTKYVKVVGTEEGLAVQRQEFGFRLPGFIYMAP